MSAWSAASSSHRREEAGGRVPQTSGQCLVESRAALAPHGRVAAEAAESVRSDAGVAWNVLGDGVEHGSRAAFGAVGEEAEAVDDVRPRETRVAHGAGHRPS